MEEYELSRVALEDRRQEVVSAHDANDSWATSGEVVMLKMLAKTALEKLWAFHQAYTDGEAAAFARVALVLVTTDVALKIFGKAAASGSPAVRLLRKKNTWQLSWMRCRGAQWRPMLLWGARPRLSSLSGTGARNSTR